MSTLASSPPGLRYFGPNNPRNTPEAEQALTEFRLAVEEQADLPQGLGIDFGTVLRIPTHNDDFVGVPPLGSPDYFLQLVTNFTDVKQSMWHGPISERQDAITLRVTPYRGVKEMRGVLAMATDRHIKEAAYAPTPDGRNYPIADSTTRAESFTGIVRTPQELEAILRVLGLIMRGEVRERNEIIPAVVGAMALAKKVRL